MAVKRAKVEATKTLEQIVCEDYAIYNGDCVEVLAGVPDNSIHMSIFSPPFLNLYVYSSSPRDLGNAKTDAEFWIHFGFVVDQLFRVMMPGRIVAFHCMNVPAMKERDGYIGLKNFRDQLIRAFEAKTFIFHSEHCIWKDPLIEATRTKAKGLMHKQLMKDSSACRAGIPDYMIAMRKPGENPIPIPHENGLDCFAGENEPTEGNLSHERWRRYASPVWMDIRQTRTLQAIAEDKDERHVCPLQLDAIERAVYLWSNKRETILSPFAGIGSEGYTSILMDRRFIGTELKTAYFDQMKKNLDKAVADAKQATLFGEEK